MNKKLLKTKIEQAEQQLTIAEGEFATAVRELRGVPRAAKTVMTALIESALDNLRASKSKVSELKKLLDTDEEL
jgi:hypothetical protein